MLTFMINKYTLTAPVKIAFSSLCFWPFPTHGLWGSFSRTFPAQQHLPSVQEHSLRGFPLETPAVNAAYPMGGGGRRGGKRENQS